MKRDRNDGIESNIGFLVWCMKRALRIRGPKVPVPTYLGSAAIGFLRAEQTLDGRRGNIRSYAYRAIVRECIAFSRLDNDLIRRPIEPGSTLDSQKAFDLAARPVESIYEPVWNGRRKSSLWRRLPDRAADAGERHLSQETRDKIVKYIKSVLSFREYLFLSLRWGLEGGEPMTLQEVADEVKRTRERIRQVEARAIRRLQSPSVCRRLAELLQSDENADEFACL